MEDWGRDRHGGGKSRNGRAWVYFIAVASGLLGLTPVSADRTVPRLLLGTKSSNLTATVVYNTHAIPMHDFKTRKVSLHILIPTIGRRTIFRLLDSLQRQVESQDHVTVVFDGKDTTNIRSDLEAKLKRMPGFNRAVMEGTNANDYGASIKSKYKHNVGDFIMFADDDNWYEPDALDTVRTVVQHDLDALYVFQYRHTTVAPDLPGHFIPDLERNGEVEVGNIDTGCGVVPLKHVNLSDWTRGSYTADGDFYFGLSESVPRTYMVKKVIYVYNGGHLAPGTTTEQAQSQ